MIWPWRRRRSTIAPTRPAEKPPAPTPPRVEVTLEARIEKHRARLAKEREWEAERARQRAAAAEEAARDAWERDQERMAEALAKDGVYDPRWSSFDSTQPRRPRFWPTGLWPW